MVACINKEVISSLTRPAELQFVEDNELEVSEDAIKDKIHGITKECFEAISSELTFQPLPNCFEFFGFDFLSEYINQLFLD